MGPGGIHGLKHGGIVTLPDIPGEKDASETGFRYSTIDLIDEDIQGLRRTRKPRASEKIKKLTGDDIH
jgi:hypothetical protein